VVLCAASSAGSEVGLRPVASSATISLKLERRIGARRQVHLIQRAGNGEHDIDGRAPWFRGPRSGPGSTLKGL